MLADDTRRSLDDGQSGLRVRRLSLGPAAGHSKDSCLGCRGVIIPLVVALLHQNVLVVGAGHEPWMDVGFVEFRV